MKKATGILQMVINLGLLLCVIFQAHQVRELAQATITNSKTIVELARVIDEMRHPNTVRVNQRD